MKISWFDKESIREFSKDIYIIHKIVLGVLMLVMGTGILWLSLGWLIKKPESIDVLLIEGRIVKYEVFKKSEAYIMIDPSISIQDSLAERKYFFDHFEAFDQAKFERDGGGLNAVVKLGVDSRDLNHLGFVLKQVVYLNRNYIDNDLNYKLRRKNQWYGFIAALMALTMSFALFKLVGMLRADLKVNRPSD